MELSLDMSIPRETGNQKTMNIKRYAKMFAMVIGIMAYITVAMGVLIFAGIYYMKDHPDYQEGWKKLSGMLGI